MEPVNFITKQISQHAARMIEQTLRQALVLAGEEVTPAAVARITSEVLPNGAAMYWLDGSVPICFIGDMPVRMEGMTINIDMDRAFGEEAIPAFENYKARLLSHA